MLSTLWKSATHSPLASQAGPTHAPSTNSPSEHSPATSGSAQSVTPFTDFVLSRLPDEASQKLFALTFGEHLRHDPDALIINFDHVYKWLGYDRKDHAVRLLKKEIPEGEYALPTVGEGTGPANKVSYLISFNQFEELMIAAQTAEGKRARKLVLLLKKILQEYIVAEQEKRSAAQDALRSSESARANALQKQLEGLRAQQLHLYAYRLYANRYKIGIAKDVERRAKQHSTSCPSGNLVHSVAISSKWMEKILEATLKKKGNWITNEEYEIDGDHEQIKVILSVFTRMEEMLNATPLAAYRHLLRVQGSFLAGLSIASEGTDSVREAELQTVTDDPPDEEQVSNSMYADFCDRYVIPDPSPAAHFTLKGARAVWLEWQGALARERGTAGRELLPSEAALRRGLTEHLGVLCLSNKRIPGGKKMRSVFMGYKLV